MRPHPSQAPIRVKVSTMPRQKTEAAAYLDIYKVVTEKKRLEQELERLEQRREIILKRLEVLETQVTSLETTAHQLREGIPLQPRSNQPPYLPETHQVEHFNTLFLEY